MINESSLVNNEKILSRYGSIGEKSSRYKETSAKTLSSWFVNVTRPLKFIKLNDNIIGVVAIVDGGIAGLTTAYLPSKIGKKVAVVEDGYIGNGETRHTTAHTTCALDDKYFSLEKIFGIDGAKLAAEIHNEAIDFIESIVDK